MAESRAFARRDDGAIMVGEGPQSTVRVLREHALGHGAGMCPGLSDLLASGQQCNQDDE